MCASRSHFAQPVCHVLTGDGSVSVCVGEQDGGAYSMPSMARDISESRLAEAGIAYATGKELMGFDTYDGFHFSDKVYSQLLNIAAGWDGAALRTTLTTLPELN